MNMRVEIGVLDLGSKNARDCQQTIGVWERDLEQILSRGSRKELTLPIP